MRKFFLKFLVIKPKIMTTTGFGYYFFLDDGKQEKGVKPLSPSVE
jgi:hypothetical protein